MDRNIQRRKANLYASFSALNFTAMMSRVLFSRSIVRVDTDSSRRTHTDASTATESTAFSSVVRAATRRSAVTMIRVLSCCSAVLCLACMPCRCMYACSVYSMNKTSHELLLMCSEKCIVGNRQRKSSSSSSGSDQSQHWPRLTAAQYQCQ
eukprot:2641-Heterococcus_DN1.PRE.2